MVFHPSGMRLLLCLAGALAAGAQPISFGVKAGVPVTDSLNTSQGFNVNFTSANNRYLVGPTVELKLPFGLGVEFDALYRRLNYNGRFFGVDTSETSRTTGNAWEFPLLAKYRFPTKVVRPYVDAGIAWDTLSGLSQTATTFGIPTGIVTTTTSNPPELRHTTTTGFVIGGGIDVHALIVHVSPEIRYTRWGSQHFLFSNPNGGGLHSNQDQVELLVGITF